MKKRIAIICLFFAISALNYAQGNYKIGINTGVVIGGNIESKTGIGTQITLSYVLSNDFDVYLASGFFTWGESRNDVYNRNLVPLIVGSKYKFNIGKIRPFILLEIEKTFGTFSTNLRTVYDDMAMKSSKSSWKSSNSALNLAFGGGVMYELDDNVEVDLMFVTAPFGGDNKDYHKRVFLGINYSF